MRLAALWAHGLDGLGKRFVSTRDDAAPSPLSVGSESGSISRCGRRAKGACAVGRCAASDL